MKFRGHSSSDAGGVLVIVLTILLVAGAMTAGWITVMTTQLKYAELYFETAKREVAFGNASGVARQYFLNQVLTKSSGAGVTVDLGDGWGAVSIPASNGTPLTTFQKSAGYNHFSPGNGDGYSQTVIATLGAGSISRTVNYMLKSRSHALGGSPLVMNNPGALVSGTITVSGNSLLWEPGGTFSLQSASFAVPTLPSGALIGLGGSAIAASNFPFIPMTGSESGGVAAYDGILNVIQNASGINSLSVMAATSSPNGQVSVDGSIVSNTNGVECDGAGTVTIDLGDPSLGNVRITSNVTVLNLTGQSSEAERVIAGNAAAVLIVVSQTSPVTEIGAISLNLSNNRKLVLAIKSPTGNPVTFQFPAPGAGSWRLMLTLESTPASIQAPGGNLTWVGGIQSDRAVAVVSGSVSILPESDPKLLERLTARDGWIEGLAQ